MKLNHFTIGQRLGLMATLLLLATLILYVIYSWLVGANRLRLG